MRISSLPFKPNKQRVVLYRCVGISKCKMQMLKTYVLSCITFTILCVCDELGLRQLLIGQFHQAPRRHTISNYLLPQCLVTKNTITHLLSNNIIIKYGIYVKRKNRYTFCRYYKQNVKNFFVDQTTLACRQFSSKDVTFSKESLISDKIGDRFQFNQ